MRPVHKQLKKHNAKLTLMTDRKKIKNSDAGIYERIIGIENVEDTNEWIELAKAINKIEPFYAIGAYHEKLQDKAALIAEELGLNFYSYEVIQTVRNKVLMREKLNSNGIDNVKFSCAINRRDIERFIDGVGLPVVLKPVDEWGSIGVSIIKEKNEIDKALALIKAENPNKEVLVEEYLNGDEYSVEVFSQNGKHIVTVITKKFKNQTYPVEKGHVVFASIPSSIRSKIEKKVYDCLACLGITHGPSHTEVIVDPSGNINIVETHTRLGGDFIPELIEKSTGIDLIKMTAQQTLGEDVGIPELKIKHYHAIWYYLPEEEGEICEINGLENVRASEGVVEANLLKNKGDVVRSALSSFDRLAYVIAKGNSTDDALSKAKNAIKKINVKLV
ncbi:hypothetical protein B23_3137 [Geobacillus thermoleovorans B23]|jgi:biotin carboxylase|nr:hypothetical protein B23_3137 [Geobacillus thermoleovorans B23]